MSADLLALYVLGPIVVAICVAGAFLERAARKFK